MKRKKKFRGSTTLHPKVSNPFETFFFALLRPKVASVFFFFYIYLYLGFGVLTRGWYNFWKLRRRRRGCFFFPEKKGERRCFNHLITLASVGPVLRPKGDEIKTQYNTLEEKGLLLRIWRWRWRRRQ